MSGSDAAPGTAEQPYRTAQKLVSSLAPGETGCLQGGTYAENLIFRRGGLPGQPITLTSAPGTRATVRGILEITDSANDVVVTNLKIDTRNEAFLPSPIVLGDRVSFIGNEVTNYNQGTICFSLGHRDWGVAVDTVIDGNRIHGCGRLPSNNQEHGVYVDAARNARIVNNLIYDNAAWGVHLYPDAQNTLVANNIIDGNGQGIIFAGAHGLASSNNRVVGNIISNSLLQQNVMYFWPAGNPIGADNVVERNCLWNGKTGDIAPQVGFIARDNVIADPGYLNRADKDFRLKPESPCARMEPN